MVLEVCPAWRDEHELPRGGKCKRAQMPAAKWAIKAETCASEEEEETVAGTAAAVAVAAAMAEGASGG